MDKKSFRWFYVTMEFTTGALPWMGQKREDILAYKSRLCLEKDEAENFKGCPKVSGGGREKDLTGVPEDLQIHLRSGVRLDPGLQLHKHEAPRGDGREWREEGRSCRRAR